MAHYKTYTKLHGFCSNFIEELRKQSGNQYKIQSLEIVNKDLDIPNLKSKKAKEFHRYDSLKFPEYGSLKKDNSPNKVDLIYGANTDFKGLSIYSGNDLSLDYENEQNKLAWLSKWKDIDFSESFYETDVKLLLRKDSTLHKRLLSSQSEEEVTGILKNQKSKILVTLDSTTNYQLQKKGYEEFVLLTFSDNNNIDYRYKSRIFILTTLENKCKENIDCNYVYASDALILETLLDQGYRELGYTIYPENGGLHGTEEEKYAIILYEKKESLNINGKNITLKTLIKKALDELSKDKPHQEQIEEIRDNLR